MGRDIIKNREWHRVWMSKRRASYMWDKVCANCGSNENLELDHINRFEKTEHKIWSWTEERRNKELLKCQVLCRKCHSIKTTKDLYGHMVTETEYYCGRCKTMKDKILFIKNGKGRRPKVCKECKSKSNKLRNRKKPIIT